jgi:UDP-N-acetylglucosamine--N-acetylmuramyl-(pentapeptide) pyrophosphoryl-undecaprenol N-acetylglucosamine transferase
VGNPVRAEIAAIAPPEARFAGREGPLRLLVLGGSQGARALNGAVPRAIASLPRNLRFDVRHQCGEKMRDEARAGLRAGRRAGVGRTLHCRHGRAYAWADIVICRAGALTLAELCAVGVGSVLVPFPQAVDDHQTKNAQFLVDRNAAQLLPQGSDVGELAQRLSATLEILGERDLLLPMARAARALARPDAAERVATIVLDQSNKEHS